MSLKILSDSSCDIEPELLEKYDVETIPFLVSLEGEVYLREKIDISLPDFYKQLRTRNVYPKTSTPSIQSYTDVFRKYLEKGNDILCFTISSLLSASIQSAVNAAQIMRKEYPERNIEIVDSKSAGFCQGALVLEAAKMCGDGKPLSEILRVVELLKEDGRLILTVDSLTYLQKGGRIGKASALAGGLLNIKPIIVIKNGELYPSGKVRGRKKAIAELVELLNKDIGQNKDDFHTFVYHSDEYEEAVQLKEALVNEYGYKMDYPISNFGTTTGAHTGPTLIGVGYMRKYETVI